jgi:hypothetical protein
MKKHPSPLSPNEWMIDLFGSRAASSDGVVRRKARDIERYVGRSTFETELRRRGFRAIENADQIVIFCNQEPIRVIR